MKHERSYVEEKVLEAIKEIASEQNPDLNCDLQADYALDSLDMVELAMKVEDLLEIDNLPDEQIGVVKTGRDIVDVVLSLDNVRGCG